MRSLLLLSLCLALTAGAQDRAPSPFGTYSNPGLHLTFVYPSNLRPLSQQATSATENRQIDNEDATSVGNSPCSNVLLLVGDATSSIRLTEMAPACLPPKSMKNRKQLDRLLSTMTVKDTALLGTAPLGEPAGYLLQGQRAFLSAAQGQPVVQGNLQPSDGNQVRAEIAVSFKGHVLMWRLISKDPATLTILLHSLVDLGTGHPQPLYPGVIGTDGISALRGPTFRVHV